MRLKEFKHTLPISVDTICLFQYDDLYDHMENLSSRYRNKLRITLRITAAALLNDPYQSHYPISYPL